MQAWTARLFQQSFGQWRDCRGVRARCSLSYLYTACIAKFGEQFELTEMNNAQVKWATHVILVLLHVVLLSASSVSDPSCVAVRPRRSFREWLVRPWLAEEPGQWLLVLSVGLVAYAIHMLILARYYRIVTQ